MKKLICTLAVLSLCGSIVSCGKKNEENSNTSSNTAVATTTVQFDFEESTVSAVISETGEIDPFTDFEPKWKRNEDGTIEDYNVTSWFDTELAQALYKNYRIGGTISEHYSDGTEVNIGNYIEGETVIYTLGGLETEEKAKELEEEYGIHFTRITFEREVKVDE